jgi:hypothetical protein
MGVFFKVCDIKKNSRSLIDFEAPIWYVQRLNSISPGIVDKFREYLAAIKS